MGDSPKESSEPVSSTTLSYSSVVPPGAKRAETPRISSGATTVTRPPSASSS